LAGLAAHIRVGNPFGRRGCSGTASSAQGGPLGTEPNPPDAADHRLAAGSQPAANPYVAADAAAVADREASGIADEGAGEAAFEPAESSGTGSLSKNV
jgi:hypothetical protein